MKFSMYNVHSVIIRVMMIKKVVVFSWFYIFYDCSYRLNVTNSRRFLCSLFITIQFIIDCSIYPIRFCKETINLSIVCYALTLSPFHSIVEKFFKCSKQNVEFKDNFNIDKSSNETCRNCFG